VRFKNYKCQERSSWYTTAKNKIMEVHVYLKGSKQAVIYKGDRIDVLDFEMKGIKYKQIRYFRKGLSKSELVEEEAINKIVKMEI
jgi:hypothetical protein